jgi:hypothetical protein
VAEYSHSALCVDCEERKILRRLREKSTRCFEMEKREPISCLEHNLKMEKIKQEVG